jgi:hypothetical protein
MRKRREAGNPDMQGNDEAGTAGGDEIAVYLDELRRRLTSGIVRISAEHAAQIVDEGENHLREAAAMWVTAGMREDAAQVAAVEAFGPTRTVARAHRPRAAAVVATLGASACPLLAVYLLLASAAGGVFVVRQADANPLYQPALVGQPQVKLPAPGYPVGQAGLLLAACALAGLVALAGYLNARQRRSPGRVSRAVPLPGFFFPVAGVSMLLLTVAERKAAALAPLYNLPGGHELLAMGAPAAAILTALACGVWSVMLLGSWTVSCLTRRSSAIVRA